MARSSVKVLHGALDERDNEVILRGVIDPSSFDQLLTAPYQREVLPLARINSLVDALKTSTVPDVELGMRGGDFMERESAFYLKDDVYIIDGQQRITAGRLMMQQGYEKMPMIGATIHFNTTEDWERERFRILNMERAKLSPNILLRNMQHDHEAVGQLHSLSTKDKNFVLCEKVCWSQRMRRDELISALTFCKTVGSLHSHLGPGRSHRTDDLSRGLDKIMAVTGPNVLRDNTRTLFDVVDQCWGIRTVTFREGAVYLRSTFLACLATLFSRHKDFWRNGDSKRLFVEKDMIRKIKLFPINDPQVINLASASGKAGDILYQLLLNHVNSGRRTGRLTPNEMAPVLDMEAEDSETEKVAAEA